LKIFSRFIVVVAVFGSCLNLLQSNLRLLLPSTPIYSSLRNLKSLDFSSMRKLVNPLSGGGCEWVEPKMVDQSPTFDLFSTILVAYPGSAKRAAFLQLEGLTELLTTDDYSLSDGDISNNTKYAFIKTQYPHHEGIWSWGARGNQTIYVLQNPRTALQTYMFLLHEINYSNSWWTSFTNIPRTFTIRPSVTEWKKFKDARFFREVHSWSWHLEYWMENGLFRDIFSHNRTTSENMFKLMNPSIFTEAELDAYQDGLGVSDTTAAWDPHCIEGDMYDCRPVAIVSYEKLIDPLTGPTEVGKLAAVIQNQPGMNVVQQSQWGCVWEKIVIEKASGLRDDDSREGLGMDAFTFTEEEVMIIIGELKRLVTKYTNPTWTSAAHQSGILVTYLEEYIAEQFDYLLKMKTP